MTFTHECSRNDNAFNVDTVTVENLFCLGVAKKMLIVRNKQTNKQKHNKEICAFCVYFANKRTMKGI